MYTAFYGLREKPFSLTPDPRFLFLSASHREALAHLVYGIEQGEGFIAVTGEVGTGKTTLCRTLLHRLGGDTEVAFVFNPRLSGEELLRAICAEFGLDGEGLSRAGLHSALNRFLLDMNGRGRRVLLIVDEAQNLPAATLEEIRLLSNLETATSKLIQILLFGQPELDAMLDSKELRQLRQRISVRWSLGALSNREAQEYVCHRLRIAAGGDCNPFTRGALRQIRRRARGVPRLMNLLADRALLAGYAAGDKRIRARRVGQAAQEILGARRRGLARRRVALFRWSAAAVVALAAGVVGASLWERFSRPDSPTSAELARPVTPAASVSAGPPGSASQPLPSAVSLEPIPAPSHTAPPTRPEGSG